MSIFDDIKKLFGSGDDGDGYDKFRSREYNMTPSDFSVDSEEGRFLAMFPQFSSLPPKAVSVLTKAQKAAVGKGKTLEKAQSIFDDFVKTIQPGIDAVNQGGGGGGGGLVQTGEDVTLPPVDALLGEFRARRGDNSVRAQNQVTATQNLSRQLASSDVFPGFNEGGLADIMAGFLSGKGKDNTMITPEMRRPKQTKIDMGLLDLIGQQEPEMEAEMPRALALAKMIFDSAVRTPRYAQVSSGSSAAAAPGGSDASALLDSILGG